MPHFSKHYAGSLKSRFIRLGKCGKNCSKLLQFLTLNRGNCFSGFPVAHPVEKADAAFRDLIFEDEIQRMQDSLEFLNLSLNEMIPFDGEPVALGTPTFEGEEGKEFWTILLSF